MPLYTFRNKDTSEQYYILISYDELHEYLKQ